MKKFTRDFLHDTGIVALEFIVVVVKVSVIYMIINLATDLHHDIALETAILIGAVDFLNGQRTSFKTVSDVRDRLSITERGKKITRTFTKHTVKRG